MSGLRDVVFTVVLLSLVPVSFLRPWIGVLAWSWIAYMAPHTLTWGFARVLPVAVLIGGATLLGFVLTKEDRKPLPRVAGTVLMVALALHFIVTTIFAYDPTLAYGKLDWVLKAMLMTFVTMSLFQDRFRLRLLYLVMALSMGFYGLKGGLWVLRTGGSEHVQGPEQGTFFGDNNTLGLALCMVLPLLLYLSREEERRWMKIILRITFAGSIIGILFTYSRGAFLGLAVILGILIWRSPWRLRFGVALLVTSLVAAPLVPQKLWNRILSIADQDSVETRDQSASGRLEAWSVGWNVALSRPLTGAGFRAFHNDAIWEWYHPGLYVKVRDAHSLYFEVLGEHGFLGFGLYMALVINTLLHLRRIRKRWRGHPEHGYLSHYAEMTQLSIYPFLVAGAFLTVAYFDLFQHLVGTAIILQGLALRAEAAERAKAPVRPGRAAARLAPAARPRPMLGTGSSSFESRSRNV
jgi:probable O-glycosylation ligase (exosortase A-associated)